MPFLTFCLYYLYGHNTVAAYTSITVVQVPNQ